MKSLVWVGVLLVVLGSLSFVVPIPHSEGHGVKVGGAEIGITTESHRKVPSAVGIILVSAGALVLVVGSRKS